MSTVFLIALLILLFLSWLYLYNIYEVRIELSDANTDTNYIVNVEPLNSFGKSALFRGVDYSYEIMDGGAFVENIERHEKSIHLKLKEQHGEVKLSIKTNKSLNSTIITLPSTN